MPTTPHPLQPRIARLYEIRTNFENAAHAGVAPDLLRLGLQRRGFGSLQELDRRIDALERTVASANAPTENLADLAMVYSRNALQGATLGFSDELAGLIPGGETTESLRAQLAQDQANHPVLSGVSQGFGALAPSLLTGGLTGGAALPAAGRIGLGALVGGAEGLLAGAGRAEGGWSVPEVQHRLAAGVGPGLLGAVTGGAVPTAAAVAPTLRGSSLLRGILQRSAPELEQAGQELAGMHRATAPSLQVGEAAPARVMDTRLGRRLANLATRMDPTGAGTTLEEAATQRLAQLESQLERMKAAGASAQDLAAVERVHQRMAETAAELRAAARTAASEGATALAEGTGMASRQGVPSIRRGLLNMFRSPFVSTGAKREAMQDLADLLTRPGVGGMMRGATATAGERTLRDLLLAVPASGVGPSSLMPSRMRTLMGGAQSLLGRITASPEEQ